MKIRTIEKCRVEGYQYCCSRMGYVCHGRQSKDEPGDLNRRYRSNQIWLDVRLPDGEALSVDLHDWFRGAKDGVNKPHVEKVCGELVGKNIKLQVIDSDGYILGVYRPAAKSTSASCAD